MNNLREKLMNCPDEQGWTNPSISRAKNLEQITDDFSIKFVKWYNVSKYDFPNEMTIEEKQKYFKENVYNK